MARLILALPLLVVALAGCGGNDAAEACDDVAFAAQKKTLADVQDTIDNAIAAEAPEGVIAEDLRRGADVLEAALTLRPCDPELVDLRETELAVLARMLTAADAFERGDDPPRDDLTRALADILAVQERLVARKG